MYPILFSIGRVNFYTHGLMIILGVIVGGWLFYLEAKREKLNVSLLFDLIIYSLLLGIIGARILYVALYFHEFSSLKEAIFVWNGGLVSYGGIIGGGLAAYWILKRRNENIGKWFDAAIVGLLLAWAIGRIGCLLNGDSFGILSSSKIAIWGRLPTQLFESIWCLGWASSLLFFKNRYPNFRLPSGTLFWLGLGGYAIGRFVIDFWREEDIIFLGLKAGQLGSIMILIMSLIVIFQLINLARKEI